MLKAIAAAVVIGAVCGLWLALVNDSVEIFQNYVDGAWQYQFAVHSFAEILVSVVVGALAGANIRLGLAPQRADGFALGTLVGVVVGIALSLAQVIIVILAVQMREYDPDYNFLLTRFSGIVGAAALLGGANGLLTGGRLRISASSGAVIGALVVAAFHLPGILAVVVAALSTAGVEIHWAVYPIYATRQLAPLLAAAACVAVLAAVFARQSDNDSSDIPAAVGMLVGAVVAVTASGRSFHFVILGLGSVDSSFSLSLLVFRLLVGLLLGIAVGWCAMWASKMWALKVRDPERMDRI